MSNVTTWIESDGIHGNLGVDADVAAECVRRAFLFNIDVARIKSVKITRRTLAAEIFIPDGVSDLRAWHQDMESRLTEITREVYDAVKAKRTAERLAAREEADDGGR